MKLKFVPSVVTASFIATLMASIACGSSEPIAIEPNTFSSVSANLSHQGITQASSVQLSTAVPASYAGDWYLHVNATSELPETLKVGTATFSKLSQVIRSEWTTYATDLESALVKLPELEQLEVVGVADGIAIEVEPIHSTPESTTLIYEGNPTAVSIRDVALILATIQVDPDTAATISTRANDLLASPGLISAGSLNPVPNSTNTNFVDSPPGTLNVVDVAAVLARIQVGSSPTAIANRINELLNSPGLVSASDILVVPGTTIPGGPAPSPIPGAIPCSDSALASAINTANSNNQADTIQLSPSCTYTVTQPEGLAINLDSDGNANTVTLRGATGTIISGNNLNRVFQVTKRATLILEDLTIANGSRPGGDGGNLLNLGGTITLDNTTVTSGSAARGGGIFNGRDDSSNLGGPRIGTLNINENSQIVGNSASLDGGGVYNSGSNTSLRDGSDILSNQATQDGGGIYNADFGASTSVVTVVDVGSEVRSNSAANGGGFYNQAIANSAIGGINQIVFSDAVLINANTASVNGGALFNDAGQVRFNTAGNQINGNQATQNGGAIYQTSSNGRSPDLRIVNNTLVDSNTAGQRGGALFNNADGATVVLGSTPIGVRVQNNRAGVDGAAFFNSGSLSGASQSSASCFTNNFVTPGNGNSITNTASPLFRADGLGTQANSNWWGLPTGPGAQGERISGVDADPFLTQPRTIAGSLCDNQTAAP